METDYKPGQLLEFKDNQKELIKLDGGKIPDYIKVLFGPDRSNNIRVQCSYISRLDYISDFHEHFDVPISELRNSTAPISFFSCDIVGRRGGKTGTYKAISK